jgi:hypothetical protein
MGRLGNEAGIEKILNLHSDIAKISRPIIVIDNQNYIFSYNFKQEHPDTKVVTIAVNQVNFGESTDTTYQSSADQPSAITSTGSADQPSGDLNDQVELNITPLNRNREDTGEAEDVVENEVIIGDSAGDGGGDGGEREGGNDRTRKLPNVGSSMNLLYF